MVDYADIISPPDRATIVSDGLAVLAAAEFPTTSWHSTSVPRALLEFEASALADLAQTVAEIGKMGVWSSASGDSLKLLGKDWFGEDKKPAISTVGTIGMTETSGVTHNFAANELIFTSSANGKVFRNSTATTVLASAVNSPIALIAESPGAAWNVSGDTIALSTPVPGITLVASAGVGWITQSGADEETDSAFRERCPLKWSTLTHEYDGVDATVTGTGSAAGYKKVALDASSEINRVVVTEDPTAVSPDPMVTIVIASTSGVPTAGALTAVTTAIDAVRPLGIQILVSAATTTTVNIYGNVSVKTAYRAAAEAAITDALARYFEGTTQTLNGEDLQGVQIGGTVVMAEIVEILMSPKGVRNAVLTDVTNTAIGLGAVSDVALASTAVAVLVNHLTYTEV